MAVTERHIQEKLIYKQKIIVLLDCSKSSDNQSKIQHHHILHIQTQRRKESSLILSQVFFKALI